MLPGVIWVEDACKSAEKADLLVLLAEWNEFRTFDLKRLADKMTSPHMVDLRNTYFSKEANCAGFTAYASIGQGSKTVF